MEKNSINFLFGRDGMRTILASYHPKGTLGVTDLDAVSVGLVDRDWERP